MLQIPIRPFVRTRTSRWPFDLIIYNMPMDRYTATDMLAYKEKKKDDKCPTAAVVKYILESQEGRGSAGVKNQGTAAQEPS